MSNLKSFWVDKYEPSSIDDMVLTEDIKTYFRNLLSSENMFNCLLFGQPGIGKTTLSNVITKTIPSDVLFIPCAVKGGVSTVQNEIKDFCDSVPVKGKQKIVILDELDSASGTQDNSFQKALRNVISEAKDTMFIGTCNYIEKVIYPIKSRLGTVSLSYGLEDLIKHLSKILNLEKIKYDSNSLKIFAKNAIKNLYPDIRRIISELQSASSSGELKPTIMVKTSEKETFFKDLYDCSINEEPLTIREFYLKNKSMIGGDYVVFAGEFFNWMMDNNKITETEKILGLNNLIYKLNQVIDKETMFFSFLLLIK